MPPRLALHPNLALHRHLRLLGREQVRLRLLLALHLHLQLLGLEQVHLRLLLLCLLHHRHRLHLQRVQQPVPVFLIRRTNDRTITTDILFVFCALITFRP